MTSPTTGRSASTATAEEPGYLRAAQHDGLRGGLVRLRSGEMGSLPALIGLIVLVILFALLRPTFLTPLNFANFFTQAALVMILAMGLVFVLLLGEIDLSAGVTSGVAAAILAVLIQKQGVAWPVAVAAALAAGIAIGLFIGLMVARIGVPSFVVTLALFLGLQGLVLVIIGEGGNIRITEPVILAIQNRNLPPLLGWVFYGVVVAGYVIAALLGRRQRLSRGFPATPLLSILAKATLLAVLGFGMVWVLNLERSVNPAKNPLSGVPIIVPIIALLTIVFWFLLNRTSLGRHIYAVGGNVEAARRAGISISYVRIVCFCICSGTAAFAGLVYASRAASVDPNAGRFIVLSAVAAAVIGGTSLFGGRGRIQDALIGGAVVAVIDNGMGLLGYSAGTKLMITGGVLMLAASADALSRRRRLTGG